MLRKGRYQARLAETADDIAAAQRLRYRAFIAATGAAPRADGREADPFDAICTHILVEEPRSGRLVCCLRLLPLKDGADIGQSYSAQYYELAALKDFRGRMVEMGRFCIDPDHALNPDICLLYTSPSPRDQRGSRMPSSA